MRKVRFIILFYSIIFTSLSACNSMNIKKFEKLLDITNQHKTIPIVTEEILDYIYYPKELQNSFEMKFELVGMRNFLLREEAIEEVNELFDELSFNYGMYAYYGKNTFNQARQQIIIELNNMNDRIAINELKNVYIKHFSFIKDMHFRIDDASLHPIKSIYYSKDLWLGKDENGYYLLSSKQYVKKIVSSDGISFENIKRVLNDNGEVHYQIVVIGNEPKNVSLLMKDNEIIPINFTAYISNHKPKCTTYEFKVNNGIPTICLMEMRELNMPMMQDFITSAINVKKYGTLTIDLRNNQGGNSEVIEEWMLTAFGKSNGHSLEIHRMGSMPSFDNEKKNKFISYGYDFSYPNHFIKTPKKEMLDNQTTIIILMNSETSSAAERFIDYLHNIKNTVFVGVNSQGNLVSDEAYRVYTMHSNIKFVYGNGIKIFDDSYFSEYVGFEPDFYYFGELEEDELVYKYFND